MSNRTSVADALDAPPAYDEVVSESVSSVPQSATTVPDVLDLYINPFKRITPAENEQTISEYVPLFGGIEEEGHGVFHWEIDRWSELSVRESSEEFSVAGWKWRLVVCPQGITTDSHASLYLACQPSKDSYEDWHACVYFCLAMSNPRDPSVKLSEAFQYRITADMRSPGLRNFAELSKLHNPFGSNTRSIIEDDYVRVSAHIRVIKDKNGLLWDDLSKRSLYSLTGYAGLGYQPGYSYMNPLLQSFYHMQVLRETINLIPTYDSIASQSLECALQQLFVQLESSGATADTRDLTSALHKCDVHGVESGGIREFYSAVREELAGAMANTAAAGAIETLFAGRKRTAAVYTDTAYTVSSAEDFYEITINVNEFGSLYDGLYGMCKRVPITSPEDAHEVQDGGSDIYQRTTFDMFPPVLHIHLDRLYRNLGAKDMAESRRKFEYPASIDLSDFLTDSSGHAGTCQYTLYGAYFSSVTALEESTSYCYLSPDTPSTWVCFKDNLVYPVAESDVFCYTHERCPIPVCSERHVFQTSPAEDVYMLVYIRCDMRELVLNSDNIWALNDILSYEKEKAEEARRNLEQVQLIEQIERQNAILAPETVDRRSQIAVRVIRGKHVRDHQGFDLYNFDNMHPNPSKPVFDIDLPREFSLMELKSLYMDCAGLGAISTKLWFMHMRVNGTLRLSHAIENADESTLAELLDAYPSLPDTAHFYCEEHAVLQPRSFSLFGKRPVEHLVHFKYYDVLSDRMENIGFTYLQSTKPLKLALPSLRQRAHLSSGIPLVLFEEEGPNRIRQLNPKWTPDFSGIGTGDIICFQVSPDGYVGMTDFPSSIVKSVPGFFQRKVLELGIQQQEQSVVSSVL